VLIIDNDFSPLGTFVDYLDYYTSTLEALGFTYDVFDALDNVTGEDPILPHAAVLSSYKAILLFTGDFYLPNGSFVDMSGNLVPTPLTALDMNRLTEYANGGGILIAMGQDLAAVANSASTNGGNFFYSSVLGGNWLQDSLTGEALPDLPAVGLADAPPAFEEIALDLGSGGDGADNQLYIDELAPLPSDDPESQFKELVYRALLRYPGSAALEDGVIAMAHRDQPTLENPGLSYLGRSIYTTFGLEGVNNTAGNTSRAELLGTFMDWALDEPTVAISNTTTYNNANLTYFAASLTSEISGTTGIMYRWDFGDGTEFTGFYDTNVAGHRYAECGDYTVRLEAVDSFGNHAIATLDTEVTLCGEDFIGIPVFFPITSENGTLGDGP
jgi:hypothetical protein